jgi:histidine triad (HIT) family protein
MECLFCRIGRGEVTARIAHEDERVVAFHDINPQAPTHLLIIPREHVGSIHDMGDDQIETLAAMFAAARRLAGGVGAHRDGYRLVFNHGANGGQTVDHVHLHLLAGRQLTWPPG